MKTIKNKILIVLLVIFALSVFLFATNVNFKSAKADVSVVYEYTDRFDDKEISNSSWTLVDDTGTDVKFLDDEYNALIFDADFDTYSSQVVYKGEDNGYKFSSDCSEYTVEIITLCEGTNNGWFALSAGNTSISNGMPYCSTAFIMAPTYSSIFKNEGGSIVPVNGINITFSPIMDKLNGQLIKTVYTFKKIGTSNEYNIEYTVETNDGALIGEYIYEGYTIRDESYFGLNANYCDLAVISFKIFEGSEEKVNCDFSESSILYPNTGSKDSDWRAVTGFDTESVKIGVVGRLDVSNEGTSAVYVNKYTRPNTRELDDLFTVKADVITSEMGVGVATGFEIGKEDIDKQGGFAGITKDDEGNYYLVSFDGINQNKVIINRNNVDGMTMELVTYYDNTAIISLGDTSLKFNCASVEGYIGLTTIDFYDAIDGQLGAKLDNFEYSRSTYKNEQSKDLSINFDGTKDTFYEASGDTVTDYYINKQDWRIGSTVIVPLYDEMSDGAITFTGASTYFGPNSKYSNFIVRFDVTFLKDLVATDAPIFGLQFGMDSLKSTVSQSNFLGLLYSGGRSFVYSLGGPIASTNAGNAPLCSDPNGQNQINIFNKGETYNVMFVAQNGTVKLFLKEASQPESVFGILRAEVKDVSTYGYLQLLTMQSAVFDLDNFSVTNLDYNMTSSAYNGNGLEIIRSDFRIGDKLNNFTLNTAEYKDTSLLIKENGYIVSDTKVLNNIVRFKTKLTDGDVIFEQSGLKIIIASSGDNITFVYNNKIREFSLDKTIDFDGALFEVYKMGNSIAIGYVNQNEPVSHVKNYQFEINAENIFSGNVKLYSSTGDLELYSVSVFDLTSNLTIARRDYNQAIDYVTPWVERPSLQEGDSGCGSSIEGVSVIVPLLLVLSVGFILIRRKKDEKNK